MSEKTNLEKKADQWQPGAGGVVRARTSCQWGQGDCLE